MDFFFMSKKIKPIAEDSLTSFNSQKGKDVIYVKLRLLVQVQLKHL